MKCSTFSFSGHAVRRMFERGLNRTDILSVVEQGKTIAEYTDDKPLPSQLMLGFVKGRPVHVVVARDPDASICTIVTAYIPDPQLWDDDFKFRRTT